MPASRNSSFPHNSSLSEITATSVMNNSSVISVPEGCVTSQSFLFIPWDNEDNIVPKEVDNIINLLFNGICLPLLFLVSFVTNIINMVVFYKHGLKERINALLFTLSLVDLLSITVIYSAMSDVMYMFLNGKVEELGVSFQFFIKNFLVGLHNVSQGSQIVYAVVALERCLCITRPLLVKSFMSTKSTIVFLWATVFIITVEGVFVLAVKYRVLCVFDPADSTVSYINYPTDFYFRNQFIIDVWYSVFDGFLVPGISFICVTVCTIVTAIKLKKLSQWRETVSSASHSVSARDLALTRVIIGTSILFMACNVPSAVVCISSVIVPDLNVGGRYDNLARVIRRFYQLSTAINNTFNFFIYYGYGSKFRETTHRLFSFCNAYENSGDKKKHLAEYKIDATCEK